MAGKAAEASTARTPIGADLKAGVDAVSYNQSIQFTRYVRKVLPLDGYVFWVNASLLHPPAPKVQTIMGSIHYATDQHQDEQETYVVNRIVFTSEDQIDFLNDMAPNELYIGAFEGLNFAFSSRKNFYRQAELWHYLGNAIYADMRTQIIDTVEQLYDLTLIVSNSLPLWLSLNNFSPNWPFYPPPPPAFTLYPSFLIPQNLVPPWASVHIGEDDTGNLVSTPGFGQDSSQSQLAVDKVRVTMWGASNDQAMDFLAMVGQFAKDTGFIGIMNVPVVKDSKRTQLELGTIAQKKVINFEVSYLQGRVAAISRQLILGAIPTFLPAGYPNNSGHAANNLGGFVSAGASPH